MTGNNHSGADNGSKLLKPNLAEAAKSIAIVTGERDGYAASVCFQWFDDQKKGRVIPGWQHGTLRALQDPLVHRNSAGGGIYFTIKETDGLGRSAENILRVRAFFVDLDGAPLDPILRCPVKPHLIVESSPGRFHAYWLVSDCPLEKFSPLQKALIEKYHSDPSVHDLPRVMRVPGFFHMKEEPFQSRIVEINEAPPYGVRELISGLGLIPKPTNGRSPGQGQAISNGQRITRNHRHEHLKSQVLPRLHNAGLKGEALFGAAWGIVQETYEVTPDFGENEVHDLCTWFDERPVDPARPSIDDAQTVVNGLLSSPNDLRTKAFTPDSLRSLSLIRDQDPALWIQVKKSCKGFSQDLERAVKRRGTEDDNGDLPTGKLFRPLPYVKRILSEHHVISTAGDFYRWSEDAGYYQAWRPEEITGLLINWIGDEVRTAHVREIRELLLDQTAKRPEEVNPVNLLCLERNILDYDTGEILPHTPDIYLLSQFPVAFDPDAQSPLYDDFLSKAIPDPLEQDLWHEICAYTLLRDTRFQVGFLLMDDDIGNTGKSTLGEILQRILGTGNYSTVRLAELANKFKVAELHGKHANISSEVNVKDFLDDSIVKHLISGEEFKVERKFGHPFTLRNYAKIIVTANRFPNTHDCGDPFHRRWLVLQFFHRFPKQGEPGNIPRFAQTLPKEELNGVFLKVVMGLKRLRDNGGFTIPQSTRKANERFRRHTNPVADFAYQCLSIQDGQFGATLKELHDEYVRWYKDNIGESMYLRKRRFRNELQAVTGKQFDEDTSSNARVLAGITVRPEWERHEA